MPNIEIHGFPPLEATLLRSEVFKQLENTPCADGMVVTIYPTRVVDKNGNNQPFIRLVSSSQVPSDDRIILERLQGLGVDIEYLRLAASIPKES